MDFEIIAKTCPWLGEDAECLAIYHVATGNYPLCSRRVCAFWHWLYHLSTITAGVNQKEKEKDGEGG